jgi:hypothetical protein
MKKMILNVAGRLDRSDALILSGLGLLSAGLWFVDPRAAASVIGVILLAMGIRGAT